MTRFPPSSLDEELCDRIMHEDHAAGRGTDRIPDLPGNPIVAGWHELLIVLYRILTIVNNGLPPIPDLLLRLGRAGRWIHRVTCQRRGGWEAFL